MQYVAPGKPGSPVEVAPRYENYIGGIVPPGVLNVVTGPGAEIGKALATSPRIAKNHRMMLDHYSQTKNLLVSYSDEPLGLF